MAKRILLIEDDLSIQKVYTEKLSIEGLEVVSALGGEDGFALAKKGGMDLILLDIMLPGKLNGFDVLEALKKDEELKKIPVIILTNLESEEKAAKEIGAVDYVIKANTDLNLIVEKIKTYL